MTSVRSGLLGYPDLSTTVITPMLLYRDPWRDNSPAELCVAKTKACASLTKERRRQCLRILRISNSTGF